jgi:hypothetical protein
VLWSSGRLMKPGVGVPALLRACLRDAHWLEWAALGTWRKRRAEGLGLRQRAGMREWRRVARGYVRGRPVGSGRGCPRYARQVFDVESALRTRSIAAGRNSPSS